MPKFIGMAAIVGFVISLLMLIAVSFYATILRDALRDCRTTQAELTNQRIKCENKIGALNGELKASSALVQVERDRIKGLEARLDASNTVRRCVSANGLFAS